MVSLVGEVFDRIQDALSNTTDAKRAVAKYLLDNWKDTAFLTASRVAAKVGVSESVVVRFAQDVGYSGYPELQRALREALRTQISGVTSSENGDIATETSPHESIQTVFDLTLNNLQETCNANSLDSFQRAVRMISDAKRICVVAGRNAMGPATTLAVHLNEVLTNTLVIGAGNDDLFDHLRSLSGDDLLITIGLPLYNRRTVQAAEYARERGVRQVTITDSLSGPLSRAADVTLITKFQSRSYAHSHVATVFIVDLLIYLLFINAKGVIIQSLEELDAVTKRFRLTSYDS